MRQQNPEAVKSLTERLRSKGDLHKYVTGYDEEGHTLLHWAAKVCVLWNRMRIYRFISYFSLFSRIVVDHLLVGPSIHPQLNYLPFFYIRVAQLIS